MASENYFGADNFQATINDDSNSSSVLEVNLSEDLPQNDNHSKIKKGRNWFVPAVAVPQRIVLCIDNSSDIGLSYSASGSNNQIEQSSIRNEALKVFITNNLSISKDDMIALFSLQQGLLLNFTSRIEDLVKSLPYPPDSDDNQITDCDITQVFRSLSSLVNIPEQIKSKVLPPDYLIRVILVYNNSYIRPKVDSTDHTFDTFLKSPYCIFDVLYLHEAQSDSNNVIEIHRDLAKLLSPRSYLLECSRNATKVYNTMAKLLAHPYQRVNQDLWEF